MSSSLLPDSYVDRGDLDGEIARHLTRTNHLALRGVSKSGKSWLRQKLLPDAIVVQCRLKKTTRDVYEEALGQLGVRLELTRNSSSASTRTVEGTTDVGMPLVAKVALKLGLQLNNTTSVTSAPIGRGIDDLRVVAELILESGRRLVIEDLHYLSAGERQALAFDLKALWDFGLFVVVVGVWTDDNYLLRLNPDLTARVREISVVWTDDDLRKIFISGGQALNLTFDPALQDRAVSDAYGNAGILQRLIIDTLDRLKIYEAPTEMTDVNDVDALEHAEVMYAEELGSLYQPFADRVSSGIRRRSNATGIYAHAMAVVMAATDEELISGVSLDEIYSLSHQRESRIQKGNLRAALAKMEAMQVDSEGRGLVLAWAEDKMRVVDRQLLLYRKYSTVPWPWESLIEEADQRGETFDET